MRRRRWASIPEPVVTPSGDLWRLERDFWIFDPVKRVWHRVPKGFRFRASVPRILWTLFAPEDLGFGAACIHDWLYQWGGHPPLEFIDPDCSYTREEADRLLYIASLQAGKAPSRAWWGWAAVRTLGGISAWQHTEQAPVAAAGRAALEG